MADEATRSITIAAPPERCYAVAVDFERYPEWAADVKLARVVERDSDGRAVEVEFQAAAIGYTTSYTLHYDHGSAPEGLSWKLVRGDLMRAIDGAYEFVAVDGDPALTEVSYRLSVDLVVPLPGFVKRRAEVRILNTLKELKTRVESLG